MPAQGGLVTRPPHHSPDAVVVGAGIAGLAVAQRAAARGLRVLALDRGAPGGGTTHVAAGMLAPVSEAAFGEDALLRLNLAAAARYPGWIAELAEAGGPDPGYRRCGTLLVARDRDQAEALERELRFREEHGLAVERLRPSRARELEPSLAPTVRLALHAPDDHAVDPRALVRALIHAIERAGGEVRAGAPVAALTVQGERVTGVRLADGTNVPAGAVVVAAGAWSGAVVMAAGAGSGAAPGGGLAGLPDRARVPVRPVKGQLLRLRDPRGPGLVERVVRGEECYLVPRGDGEYVLGATVEERGFDTSVTAGAVHELLRAAFEVLPGVAELELVETLAGLRPGTPDNAPAIGPGALVGLHWATGHYRHGVLQAPITGDLVVAGLAGEAVEPAFAPTRFAAAGVPA
jgi:glycine oxidase